MNESFASQLKKGNTLIGTLVSLPSAEVTEILALSGFDWLFLDLEHTPINESDVLRMLQASQDKCHCAVRIPSHDEAWIKKVLDIGADGIIVPHVNSAEEAQNIANLSKYPPDGERSVGISRGQGYGYRFQEYLDTANKDIAIIIQIEHITAVRNINSILEVEGIDALFIGPYDLSASMGRLGDLAHPEVTQAIDEVREAGFKAGLPVGIFGISADAVKQYIEKNFTFIAVCTDASLLGSSAKKLISELR